MEMIPKPVLRWRDLQGKIHEALIAYAERLFRKPLPLQMKSIPILLQDRDVIIGGTIATGKTFSFILPVLNHVIDTREQVPNETETESMDVSNKVAHWTICCHHSTDKRGSSFDQQDSILYAMGGVNFQDLLSLAKEPCDLIVATPTRFLDLTQKSNVLLNASCNLLVIDGVDRLFDLGLEKQIEQIFTLIPYRKTILTTSTPLSVQNSNVKNFRRDPVIVASLQKDAQPTR